MFSGEAAKAGVYTDFQGLSELRLKARKQSPEALEAAARQFEAVFLQMMLKTMREASAGDPLFDSDQGTFYREMYDKQLALDLSEGPRGIGLARMLVEQLRGRMGGTDEGGAASGQAEGLKVPQRLPFAVTPPSVPSDASVAGGPAPADESVLDSPQAFVRHLWPHAKRAAERLGMDPSTLLAQAALETGWGKAVIRDGEGRSSHNLFNIKADHRWSGPRVAKDTLEYRDGVAARERGWFRRYESFGASFDDYVDFLKSSPRYREALEQAADPQAFVQALQRAGYATDPAYARKVGRVLSGEAMADALAAIKLS